MREELVSMCQEIADLTFRNCVARGGCRGDGTVFGACCERVYCELAQQTADRCGVEVELPGDGSLPIVEGKCTIPPHLRFLCAVHQCDICSVSMFKHLPPEETERYFDLRERISQIMQEEM